MSAQLLQLGQLSFRFSVRPLDALRDFHWVLGKGWDAVGFTEAAAFHPQLRQAAADRSYQLLLPPEGDTAIAVHRSHVVTAHDYQHVNVGKPGKGGHGPRGVQACQFKVNGETVGFCEAHWLTHRSDPHGHKRLQMTGAMSDMVVELAAGSRVAFWAGDTNNPDRPSATSAVDLALRKGLLTSCWDELGRYPATHAGHTLDVVGSYDLDGRVSCTGARTWPRLHSDHVPLSARYSIRPQKPGKPRHWAQTQPDPPSWIH